jgi:predicted AAA+ superfamily ATPase
MPGSEAWLKNWLGDIVHRPERRIPALVLIGPENSGKTTIHEAIAKQLPRGEMPAGHIEDATSGWCRINVN